MVLLIVNIHVVRMGPDLAKLVECTQEKQQACSHRTNDHERKQHVVTGAVILPVSSLAAIAVTFSDPGHRMQGRFIRYATAVVRPLYRMLIDPPELLRRRFR